MSQSPQKFSQLLSELKQDYLTALPGKVERMRALLNAENWSDLAEEYHKIKGTGKTYGFPEVSTIGEHLESLARQPNSQKKALFEQSLILLEKMCAAYAQGQDFDLQKDPIAKSILALKAK